MKLAILVLMFLFVTPVLAADNNTSAFAPTLATGTDDYEKIGIGVTVPGVGWQNYTIPGVFYIDVDTSGADFDKTPIYIASLLGTNTDIALGASSINSPTKDGFRIFVRNIDPTFKFTYQEITQTFKWSVQWIGIEPE